MCCSSFQIPSYNYLSFAIVSVHPVDAFFSRWFIFLRRVGRLLPLEPLRLGLTDSEANGFSEAGSPARLRLAFVAPADPDNVRDFPLSLSCVGRRPAPAPAWGCGVPRLLPAAARWRGQLGAEYRARGRSWARACGTCRARLLLLGPGWGGAADAAKSALCPHLALRLRPPACSMAGSAEPKRP